MAKKINNAIFPEELYIFYDTALGEYFRVTNIRLFAESQGKTFDQVKNLVYRKAKKSGNLIFLGRGDEDTVNNKVLF